MQLQSTLRDFIDVCVSYQFYVKKKHFIMAPFEQKELNHSIFFLIAFLGWATLVLLW